MTLALPGHAHIWIMMRSWGDILPKNIFNARICVFELFVCVISMFSTIRARVITHTGIFLVYTLVLVYDDIYVIIFARCVFFMRNVDILLAAILEHIAREHTHLQVFNISFNFFFWLYIKQGVRVYQNYSDSTILYNKHAFFLWVISKKKKAIAVVHAMYAKYVLSDFVFLCFMTMRALYV